MRVGATIVAAASAGALDGEDVYGVEFTIAFNDAEKAGFEKAKLYPLLAAARAARKGDIREYETLGEAQTALVDFVAAVAEVMIEAREQKAAIL